MLQPAEQWHGNRLRLMAAALTPVLFPTLTVYKITALGQRHDLMERGGLGDDVNSVCVLIDCSLRSAQLHEFGASIHDNTYGTSIDAFMRNTRDHDHSSSDPNELVRKKSPCFLQLVTSVGALRDMSHEMHEICALGSSISDGVDDFQTAFADMLPGCHAAKNIAGTTTLQGIDKVVYAIDHLWKVLHDGMVGTNREAAGKAHCVFARAVGLTSAYFGDTFYSMEASATTRRLPQKTYAIFRYHLVAHLLKREYGHISKSRTFKSYLDCEEQGRPIIPEDDTSEDEWKIRRVGNGNSAAAAGSSSGLPQQSESDEHSSDHSRLWCDSRQSDSDSDW